MAIKFLKTLSQKRNVSTYSKPYVIATVTPGVIKFTHDIAEKLGVDEASTLLLLADDKIVYIGKGSGSAKKDENGTLVTNERGRKTYEGKVKGSAVAYNKDFMQTSNAGAWGVLNGDENKTVYFTLGDPEEIGVLYDENASPTDPENQYVTTGYPLIFSKEKAKSVSDKEGVDADVETEEVADEADADFDAPSTDGLMPTETVASTTGFEEEEI